MKRTLITSLLVTIALMFTQSTEAQFLKKLKKKVQQASEEVIIEKTAQKAAQETGKAMDSLLDIDPDYQSNYQKNMMQLYSQSSADIPIESSYQFDTQVTYEMVVASDKEISEVEYGMWFSKDQAYMASQLQKMSKGDKDQSSEIPMSMVSILDDKNQAMIILMEEQKIAQVIAMNQIKSAGEIETESESESMSETDFSQLKKTGKKKDILGYSCEEYAATDGSMEYSFWITQEVNIYQKNLFYSLSRSLGGSTFHEIPESAKGLMMEMNFSNSATGEKGKMVITDIQNETKTLSTEGYNFMNLGAFMKN